MHVEQLHKAGGIAAVMHEINKAEPGYLMDKNLH